MTPFLRRLAGLLPLCALACSGMHAKNTVDPAFAMRREAGLRIAVMPFAVSAPADGFLADALGGLGDALALDAPTSVPMRDRLGASLRTDVIAWLLQTDVEVVDAWHTDTQLTHAGIAAAAAQDHGNAPRIAAALGVDAVLFGDVTRWNRSYYVVQSLAEVGLRLDLVDAGGRVLFATEREETLGAGLAGGPTGYVSAITEPIAGLGNQKLRELTRSVTRNAVADLNGGELGVVAGAGAPKLTVVGLAAMHDGAFRAGERVDVVAVGTPGCEVRFDLGRLRTQVPTQELTVTQDPRGDRATYVGHYVLQPGDTARDLPLAATIRRGAARRSVVTWYRWERRLSLAADGS